MRRRSQIILGPLKGKYFTSGELPWLLGIYELHVQYAILSALSRGDVVYDVGANNGYLSLLAAEVVGPEGHVYAFEPLPHNANRVVQLMSTNKIEDYTLVQAAVSEARGTAKLFFDHDPYTPSLLEENQGHNSITVDTVSLDEFVYTESHWPKLIKVDVEGAEMLVLQGASRLLSSHDAPIWIIELHSGSNDRAVTNLLESHGYKVERIRAPISRSKAYPRHIRAWKECGKETI